MQILSLTPNSKKIYASALEAKVSNHPDVLRSITRAGLTMFVPSTLEEGRIIADDNDDVQPSFLGDENNFRTLEHFYGRQ